MSQVSIGREFLEVAIEVEKNGGSFYGSVARQARNKEARDIFMRLAAREKEHEKTFRDMLGHIGGHQPSQRYSREEQQYIKDLGASSIFNGERAINAQTKKTMTDIEALETGIGFEKDSILFYSEIRGMVPRPDQEIIDMIVNEERKHLSEFTFMANKLRGM